MPNVHFQSITRIRLFGSSRYCDEDSVRVRPLCGCVNREENLTSSWPDVTCDSCLKLLMTVKREIA
jgi:hypothetical protein